VSSLRKSVAFRVRAICLGFKQANCTSSRRLVLLFAPPLPSLPPLDLYTASRRHRGVYVRTIRGRAYPMVRFVGNEWRATPRGYIFFPTGFVQTCTQLYHMYNSLVIRRNISKSGFVYKSHSRFTPSNKIFIYFFRQTQMHMVDCERQYTSIGALYTVNPNRAAAPWRHLAGYDRKFIARRNTCFFFFHPELLSYIF